MYSISNFWKQKIQDTFFTKNEIALNQGEKITYQFKNIEHIDVFWKNIVFYLHKNNLGPVFYGNAHNFWYLFPGRKESDRDYYKYLIKNKQYIFGLIGGKTPLDKMLKQEYGHEFVKFHFDDNFPFPRRGHVTIIGPYIITACISNKLSTIVDKLYSEIEDFIDFENKIKSLLVKPGRMLLSVENNIQKAKKLRKRIAKDFYVPRELIEKYDLF
jgi:hypothetical protein